MENLNSLFLKITIHRMTDLYYAKFEGALASLSQEQLWQEPYPKANSIGGIALHVSEHIARNILRVTGQEASLKQNFHEYFPNEDKTPSEIALQMKQMMDEWKNVMNTFLSGERKLESEHIHQLYHLVEHTGYHLGQIIDRVQHITGNSFHFFDQGLSEAYLREKIDADPS